MTSYSNIVQHRARYTHRYGTGYNTVGVRLQLTIIYIIDESVDDSIYD